jgi:hypothetical protein
VAEVTQTSRDQTSDDVAVVVSRTSWLPVGVAIVLGVGLGILGMTLVTVGRSLALPAAIIAGVGGVVVLASWVLASFRPQRRAGWIFAVSAAAATLLATVWTFEFALPAAIALSGATAQAQAALRVLQHSPQNHQGTVHPQPCVVHRTGSVGPLSAPYKACAIWTPVGHTVMFESDSAGVRGGLLYTNRASTSFEDLCVRHLLGSWWMFASSTDANGDPGSCYLGYTFIGGG